MAITKCNPNDTEMQALVNTYFSHIGDLRSGLPASVDSLMNLWAEDGVFEFVGSSPVNATYEGAVAIRTLYKNRLASNGMAVTIETQSGNPRTVSLDIVATDVTHTRLSGNRVIVGWRTTVGTTQGYGFDVAGSHMFEFDCDKIQNLRVTVSPKGDASVNTGLDISDLTVNDIGRLSLAAWPVV